MATNSAFRICICHEFLPGLVVCCYQLPCFSLAVQVKVQGGIIFAAASLEAVHPIQALLDPSRGNALHVFHGARFSKSSLRRYVDHEDFPVGLALVNQADSAKRMALNNLPNKDWLHTQIQDVQRVIITWSTVGFV
eukprot:CAMPEP_0197660304 /NCGR_PEP_ID=MMETSP1338-20131121/50766_1 /TAXON_ID=43686 ORGANISM="Pelagodinium beii, Strain RCC1491" /NCGR_SAMPLE_ID=MMETSP1338 /ASSEMBLY_ACC=CAM_ASM_000754 /LENGTH=135 /DNA_ID=CAMNT_0043237631 /DNA_START=362 /DNA_END=769 /DNA_ORIENTATION=+